MEAVEVCATSVQKASKLIAKRSSTIDGKLFLIKHLLSLREKENVRRLLRGQDLERNLKTTCKEFIMLVTKLVVDPMLSFVTKVTAVKGALSAGSQERKPDSALAKPLRTRAFATPDKVVELVQKCYYSTRVVLAKMKLCLQNPSKGTVLFLNQSKPIYWKLILKYTTPLRTINLKSIQDLQTEIFCVSFDFDHRKKKVLFAI
ncbi:hypothetical protein MKX03_025189 [Papaver bracteatum]|nr:hypothetical protein MKX03_025189 [Papaver bracteatum]